MIRMTILALVVAMLAVGVAKADDSGQAQPYAGPVTLPIYPRPGCQDTLRWNEYGEVTAHVPYCNGRAAVIPMVSVN